MALDIHLGSNKAKAEQLYPSLSFEENLHEILFNFNNGWIKDFPLFAKMNDYYTDTYYLGVEIEELKNEIERIIPRVKDKKNIEFLNQFTGVCNLANKKNHNIYCFSD